jgi:hypothetical protein
MLPARQAQLTHPYRKDTVDRRPKITTVLNVVAHLVRRLPVFRVRRRLRHAKLELAAGFCARSSSVASAFNVAAPSLADQGSIVAMKAESSVAATAASTTHQGRADCARPQAELRALPLAWRNAGFHKGRERIDMFRSKDTKIGCELSARLSTPSSAAP